MLVYACLIAIGIMALMWLVEIVNKQRRQQNTRRRNRMKAMLFDDHSDTETPLGDD